MRIGYHIFSLILLAVIVVMVAVEALLPGTSGTAARMTALGTAVVLFGCLALYVIADGLLHFVRWFANWAGPRSDRAIAILETNRISLPSWWAITACTVLAIVTVCAFTCAFAEVGLRDVVTHPLANLHHFYVAGAFLVATLVATFAFEAHRNNKDVAQ